MTTQSELHGFAVELENIHNIKLDYSQSEFFESGTLKTFISTLSDENEKISRCSADLMSLQYKYIGYDISMENGHPSHIVAGMLP